MLGIFATMLAFDGGRYLVVAGLAYLIVWVWGRARFEPRHVRGAFAPAADLHRELAYSIATAMIFAAVGTALFYGA
ncbi:MAG TPA: hypothetical protein VL463_03890, partial [Kofleriaceae bacterium]|nr:hypothetical protein [Kofleriaceae bacterium]